MAAAHAVVVLPEPPWELVTRIIFPFLGDPLVVVMMV
jgi:hypothetical protein